MTVARGLGLIKAHANGFVRSLVLITCVGGSMGEKERGFETARGRIMREGQDASGEGGRKIR